MNIFIATVGAVAAGRAQANNQVEQTDTSQNRAGEAP